MVLSPPEAPRMLAPAKRSFSAQSNSRREPRAIASILVGSHTKNPLSTGGASRVWCVQEGCGSRANFRFAALPRPVCPRREETPSYGSHPHREPRKPTTTGDAATETTPSQTDRDPHHGHRAMEQDPHPSRPGQPPGRHPRRQGRQGSRRGGLP